MSWASHDTDAESCYELVLPQPQYPEEPPISLHTLYSGVTSPRRNAPPYKRHSFTMDRSSRVSTSLPNPRTQFPSSCYQNITLEEGMSLEEFSTAYVNSLPLRVHVTKGVYGDNEDSTISTDDEYNIHFVRHREVVKVKDKIDNEVFSIPPNSLIKFGLLYDPNRSEQEALRGFNFPRVSDILAMTPRPKVVCATKAWKSKDRTASIKAMEVLLIKEAFSTGSGEKVKAYSFTDHCEKYLGAHTIGHFSTKPVNVRLYLSEILRFVPKPIPSGVVLYGTDETSGSLPSHLFSRVLQMTKNYTEVVLIVTGVTEEGHVTDHTPFEIPTDIDVEVRVVPLSYTQQAHLKTTYENLKDKIRQKPVRPYRYSNISEHAYQTQREIFAVVQISYQNVEEMSGGERVYYQDTRPFTDQQCDLVEKKAQHTEEELSSFISNADVVKMNHELEAKLSEQLATAQTGMEKNLDELKEKLSEQMQQLTAVQGDITANVGALEVKLSEQMQQLTENHGELEAKVSEQKQQLETAQVEIARLNKEVEQMKQYQASKEYINPRPISQMYGLTSEEAAEENRVFLSFLDSKQVLQLLQCSGLSQYQGSFIREDVTGDILLECDEDILQNELGVTSKLHRIKLMKLVTGKHSAEACLGKK